jgi:hypothetical protein
MRSEALKTDFFPRDPFQELAFYQEKQLDIWGKIVIGKEKERPLFPETRDVTEQRFLAYLRGLEEDVASNRYNAIVVGHQCLLDDVCAFFKNEAPDSRTTPRAGHCAITKLVMDHNSNKFRMEMANSTDHLGAFTWPAS